MKLVIFGSPQSTLGLVKEAIERGHLVTAFARDHSTFPLHPRLQIKSGDWFEPESASLVSGHDAVVVALGRRHGRQHQRNLSGVQNITEAMRLNGIIRIIVTTTLSSADIRASSFARHFSSIFCSRKGVIKLAAIEEQLAATALNWTLVRVGRLSDLPIRHLMRALEHRILQGLAETDQVEAATFTLAQLTSDLWVRRNPVVLI